MSDFKRTKIQDDAMKMLGGPETDCLLMGGSGSGKTFIALYALAVRAMRCPGSIHAVMRKNHTDVINKVADDAFPGMMKAAFPKVRYNLSKTRWFIEFPNKSRIWFYGLDKDGLEKVLGPSYSTVVIEEASQMADYGIIETVKTRLRQKNSLSKKIYYTCNPPGKGHWLYRVFVQNVNPEDGAKLPFPEDFTHMRLNPIDNTENLDKMALRVLEGMSGRKRKRFLEGEWGDEEEGKLWEMEWVYDNRISREEFDKLEMDKIGIGVDPAISTKRKSDETGIIVAGVKDGHGYIIEEKSGKYTPAQWASIVNGLYKKYSANIVVAERNRGGDLVKENIQRENSAIYVVEVVARKGKYTRAEPVAALYERGLIHHVDILPELEREQEAFDPESGASPNNLDAEVWVLHELMRIGTRVLNPIVSTEADYQESREELEERTFQDIIEDDAAWG